MKEFIVCVGASCSGKSTHVEQFLRNRDDWIELNRDDVRFSGMFNINERDWSLYKFTKGNENKVSKVIDDKLNNALTSNKNIICSDTNLSEKARNKWKLFALSNNYKYREVFFTESWDTLRSRNLQRSGGIAEHVLWSQYKRMCHYTGEVIPYTPQKDTKECVIVDVDGTIAQVNGRGHYEWNKVSTDLPRKEVIRMLWGLMDDGLEPIFLSGRDGVCKEDTYDWIMKHVIKPYYLGQEMPFYLFMRNPNDSRKDYVVKMELFDKYVRNKFNVKTVLDDRPQVLSQTWDLLNLPNIINVGGVYNEF